MSDPVVTTQRYSGLDAEAFHRLPDDVQTDGLRWMETVAPGQYTLTLERDGDTIRIRTVPRDEPALARRAVIDGEIEADVVEAPASTCPPALLAHLRSARCPSTATSDRRQ